MSTWRRMAIVAVLSVMMLALMPAAPAMARMLESIAVVPAPHAEPMRAFEPDADSPHSQIGTACPDMGADDTTATNPWEMAPGSDAATDAPGGMQAPVAPSRDDTATSTGTVLPAREETTSVLPTHRFSDHGTMYPDAITDVEAATVYGVDATEKTYVLCGAPDVGSTVSDGGQGEQSSAGVPAKVAVPASSVARAVRVEGTASSRRRSAADTRMRQDRDRLDETVETAEPSARARSIWGRILGSGRPDQVEISPATLASLQLGVRSDQFTAAAVDT